MTVFIVVYSFFSLSNYTYEHCPDKGQTPVATMFVYPAYPVTNIVSSQKPVIVVLQHTYLVYMTCISLSFEKKTRNVIRIFIYS
jgi:hypothetical protein